MAVKGSWSPLCFVSVFLITTDLWFVDSGSCSLVQCGGRVHISISVQALITY